MGGKDGTFRMYPDPDPPKFIYFIRSSHTANAYQTLRIIIYLNAENV